MTDDIIELTVGYHANNTNPFQRIICDTDFTNPYYECKGDDYNIFYSKVQPFHKISEVYNACQNLDLVMEVAKMNFESDEMIATIRDGEIITGKENMDIWGDIKVWAYTNNVYPKMQSNRLPYTKESFHSRYLKSGINEIKMYSDEIYKDGKVYSFTIKSSTFQSRYSLIYDVYNRCKFEAYHDGYSGRGYGYEYFDTFEEVQEWVMENFDCRLYKKGDTKYHHY